jgi:hypothetical protein
MTELEIEKTHVEIDELRCRIRNQLAQEHNWAEQERNWQSLKKLNSIRNYILVAGIAATAGVTLGAALVSTLFQ